MEEFRQQEINKIKKYSYILGILAILTNFILMSYFIIDTFIRLERFKISGYYTEQMKNDNLFELLKIEGIYLVFFLPFLYYIFKLTKNYIEIIKNLDNESLGFFKQYREYKCSFFQKYPSYFLMKDRAVIPRFLAMNEIVYSDILKLRTQRINRDLVIRYHINIKAKHRNYGFYTYNKNKADFFVSKILQNNSIVRVDNTYYY